MPALARLPLQNGDISSLGSPSAPAHMRPLSPFVAQPGDGGFLPELSPTSKRGQSPQPAPTFRDLLYSLDDLYQHVAFENQELRKKVGSNGAAEDMLAGIARNTDQRGLRHVYFSEDESLDWHTDAIAREDPPLRASAAVGGEQRKEASTASSIEDQPMCSPHTSQGQSMHHTTTGYTNFSISTEAYQAQEKKRALKPDFKKKFKELTSESARTLRTTADVLDDRLVKYHLTGSMRQLNKPTGHSWGPTSLFRTGSRLVGRRGLNKMNVPADDNLALSSPLVTCAVVARSVNAARGRHELGETIGFETFMDIMTLETPEELVDKEIADKMVEIRTMCFRDNVEVLVASVALVPPNGFELEGPASLSAWLLSVLEPITFVLILSNAILLGVSTDVYKEWPGWDYVEMLFTCFFCCELVLRYILHGPRGFFFGIDWKWNCTDIVFCVLGVVDCVLTLLIMETELQIFSALRLARLLRVTRLVRLLRMGMFKELVLMIKGMIAGLRTLFWAIVLLAFVIYCLGLMMRHTMGNWCLKGLDRDPWCTDAHLIANGPTLFSTVPRSCFTVFRCFTEGCGSVDGTPLLVHIYENELGWLMLTVYFFSFLAVTFGLFNLVMAVFVENTMESAKMDEVKRRQFQQEHHFEVGVKLRKLVLQFCRSENDAHFNRGFSTDSEDSAVGMPLGCNPEREITREMFARAVAQPEMNRLLQELDISIADPMNLFDALDADGSGTLDVSELVQGLLKFLGASDRSDTVASLLSVRAVQRSLRSFERRVLQNQQSIRRSLEAMKCLEDRKLETGLKWRPASQQRPSKDAPNGQSSQPIAGSLADLHSPNSLDQHARVSAM